MTSAQFFCEINMTAHVAHTRWPMDAWWLFWLVLAVVVVFGSCAILLRTLASSFHVRVPVDVECLQRH